MEALLKRQKECHEGVAGKHSTTGTTIFNRIILALFYEFLEICQAWILDPSLRKSLADSNPSEPGHPTKDKQFGRRGRFVNFFYIMGVVWVNRSPART